MKKIIPVCLFLIIGKNAFPSDTFNVSMTDVNRIVCREAVKDVFFSEEKGLVTKISGNDLFVKFPAAVVIDQQTGDKTTKYSNTPAELFLVCGDTTYSLVLKPTGIPARTIMLKSKSSTVDKSAEFKGKDEEEILSALMKAAIEERIPEGFKETIKNTAWDTQRSGVNVRIVFYREYSGSGYTVKEFRIYSPVRITILPPEVIGFHYVSNPAAAMLTSETFSGWSRAFVIERSGSER